eukprot:scaffold106537_cov56-Attheya_sp.AAC.1
MPLESQSALYTPSGYSAIHPRGVQVVWPYRSSTSWSSDQLTRHTETAPRPPPYYSTPISRGAHGSWWYTNQALPAPQVGSFARGIDAVPLGYTAQTIGATSYSTPSPFYTQPQNFTFSTIIKVNILK